MSDSTPHNIVILGGSFAGLGVAHGLLKGIPALEKETGKKFKVTLVSNSTRFWFSVGAPRAMLRPYPNDNMDSFIPISKGFSKYPSAIFDFLFAEVTSLDTAARNVIYKAKQEGDNDTEHTSPTNSTLHYDTLIIATGSQGPSPLYSLHGSYLPTLNAYKDLQARLPSAKSILLVGGGTAGTETAGELGYLHGKNSSSPKDITILSGAERLLTGLRPAIGTRAEEHLTSYGVKTIHNTRLESQSPLPNNRTRVKLSNGDSQDVDILLVATGRKATTSYLPPTIPLAGDRIETDPYLRVASLPSTWAFGDVASASNGGLMFIRFGTPVLVANVLAELRGKGEKDMKVYKPLTTKEMQVVPVGPGKGVGAVFGWWLPNFAVTMIKGKNMMFPNAAALVMGTA